MEEQIKLEKTNLPCQKRGNNTLKVKCYLYCEVLFLI